LALHAGSGGRGQWKTAILKPSYAHLLRDRESAHEHR
jgi:hypothetical protein